MRGQNNRARSLGKCRGCGSEDGFPERPVAATGRPVPAACASPAAARCRDGTVYVACSSSLTGYFWASDNSPCRTRAPMGPRCCGIASAQLPVCGPISRARSSRCSRLCCTTRRCGECKCVGSVEFARFGQRVDGDDFPALVEHPQQPGIGPRPAGPHTLAAPSRKPVAVPHNQPDAPCGGLLQTPVTNPPARATVGHVPRR